MYILLVFLCVLLYPALNFASCLFALVWLLCLHVYWPCFIVHISFQAAPKRL